MKRKTKLKKFFKNYKISLIISIFVLIFALFFIFQGESYKNQVLIKTSYGDIVVELYPNKAPITVENFKNYVEDGFYDGLVFHRVMNNFMIQGGGFEISGKQKETRAPIKLESNNGLSNEKYTIAMARTLNPDSATSQFFINTNNNNFLDYGIRDEGYAVFGKVTKGQDVVDKIEKVQTTTKHTYMQDWPVEEIIIESIQLI